MAKRFRFSLQPVLEQRKRVEDEKQQALAVRQRALDDAQAELNRLDREFRDHAQLLKDSHRGLDGEELRLHYAHLQYLDRVITAQIRVVAERRVAVDRARAELLEASKERKVVEKLKERKYESFLSEAQRVEQSELDDGNARRFGRANLQTGGAQ